MEKFIVRGQCQLSGSIQPAGNKNESLPVLAAILLSKSQITLNNLPNIGDINTMKLLLERMGVGIQFKNENTYVFDAKNLLSCEPDVDLCRKIRGSFLMASPLLYRFGEARLPVPGGDIIGRRRLDTHFKVLTELGATIKQDGNTFYFRCDKGFKGTDLFLDEASVMATENAIMAAAVAEGTTTIYNAACEPHIQGLCRMLNSMGAKIQGIGSNFLKIDGVTSLSNCTHSIQPDHIEVGSLIGLAAVTNSELTIIKPGLENLGLILHCFKRLGVNAEHRGQDLFIPSNQELQIIHDADKTIPKIDDAPWPGFPADLTSIMTVVATQCQGTILIFEKLFESRLFWVDKLISMGAQIVLCDPHRAVVVGPSNLVGMKLNSPDIRAGMALLIAAMCAKGTSEIYDIQQIDRGYEKIDQRLNALGADIQRA
ncbi:UDP-N-acetylglucosamine 1-carboxyvinyltransferase [Candidatus Magnetomorum sp. HK-1]|nr:UDP-N-acetylglucosamine 1-carboxyvinyltransferase [Candidatus Magnetomorum sp. HK-1]